MEKTARRTLFLEEKREAGEGAADEAVPAVLGSSQPREETVGQLVHARDAADGETKTNGVELDLVGLLVLHQVRQRQQLTATPHARHTRHK